jgi:hypothetical protein
MLEWLNRIVDEGNANIATRVAKKVLSMGLDESIARSVVSKILNDNANKRHRVRVLMLGTTISGYTVEGHQSADMRITPFMWGASRLMMPSEDYTFQLQPYEPVKFGATIIVWGGVFKGAYVGQNSCSIMPEEGSQVAITQNTCSIGTRITLRVEAE